MSSYKLGKELDDLKAEYEAAEKMSEVEIQDEYNTDEYNTDDSKAEFLSYLQEEIDDLQSRYDEAIEEEEAEENRDWRTAGLDPAFSSWEEVNRMFV